MADLKSNFNIDIKPRVRPHPKQEIPNRLLMGHNEQENIFVKRYRIIKKTHPALKECKVCLFLSERELNLNQGISIAVSEAAGQYGNQVNQCAYST